MASTITKRNMSGVPHRMQVALSGTYTAASEANSADSQVTLGSGVLTITPGFIPKHVKVVNVTDRLEQEWYMGMNEGDFIEHAAAGDKTLETDDKLTVDPDTGVVQVVADGGGITDNDTVVVVIEA